MGRAPDVRGSRLAREDAALNDPDDGTVRKVIVVHPEVDQEEPPPMVIELGQGE